jgi:hypothetical protein
MRGNFMKTRQVEALKDMRLIIIEVSLAMEN